MSLDLPTTQPTHTLIPLAEQVTLAQSEIEIWGEKLEATDLSEYVFKFGDGEHPRPASSSAFGDIYRGNYYPNLRKNTIRRLFRTRTQPRANKPIPVAINVARLPILSGESQKQAAKFVSIHEVACFKS
jgi:hypothetical protein